MQRNWHRRLRLIGRTMVLGLLAGAVGGAVFVLLVTLGMSVRLVIEGANLSGASIALFGVLTLAAFGGGIGAAFGSFVGLLNGLLLGVASSAREVAVATHRLRPFLVVLNGLLTATLIWVMSDVSTFREVPNTMFDFGRQAITLLAGTIAALATWLGLPTIVRQ